MTKFELVVRIHQRYPHLYQKDVEKIVDAILETITDALAIGGRAEIRGFGSFGVKHRAAREGQNPRTGKRVAVGEKKIPYFKAGKEMRLRLNQ